jgi:serine protease
MLRSLRSLGALAAVIAVAAATGAAAQSATPRLIVKFRDAAQKSTPLAAARVSKLAAESGLALRHLRPMALGADVLVLPSAVAEPEASRIAAIVAANPDVEFAVPDRVVKADFVPNDTFINAQPYLNNSDFSVSAYSAWDTTTGSPNIVVAVVDTGYTNHAGLAARWLPGYDFISDVFIANDGGGRDADPFDPGDWTTQADKDNPPPGLTCDVAPSSWHGTAVAGVIAANTNDHAWTAGIDWAAKVLPVRVLGKCGGYDSDIIDGIAWAGGLAVAGVAMNPTPAQVINLSLGDSDKMGCSAAYQSVINAVLARGITRAIVASAGNDDDDVANHTPANCQNVISVAATNSNGDKASFSNFGAVTLSAPGNNIYVLVNSGLQGPIDDTVNRYSGTSFSAPMVTGAVSLMLALAPSLTTAQIRSILTTSAKAFLPGSSCSTANCGAGLLDAGAAVRAAATTAPGTPVSLVEYYNATLDHYFITWLPAEQANLDAGNTPTRWNRTGYSIKTFTTAQPGTSDVCRFYIPPALGDSHFFGRGTTECNDTAAAHPTFVLEDPAFFKMYLPVAGVCPAATTPVYRVFDARPDANHRYTTSRAVRDQMAAMGWTIEGDGPDFVVMCAPQ